MITPSKVQIIAHLEVIGGRFAKIQSSRAKGAVLIVDHTQTNEQDSTVHLIPSSEDKNVYVAICLRMKDNIYYPVVERDTVTESVSMRLEPTTKPLAEFPKRYLFKWDSNGQFGSLCSMEEPGQYLAVKDSIIILSSLRDESFRINLNNVESNKIVSFQPYISKPHFIICKRITYTDTMEDNEIPLSPPCIYGGLKEGTKDFFS
ncbi:uncharacterized protein Hap1MRO34_023709 [Clarias gariepinus]